MNTETPRAGRTAAAAFVLAALTTPFVSTPASAYALEGPKWAAKKTNFWFAVAGSGSGTFSTAFKQALYEWNPVSAFKYVPLNRASNPCNTSGPNGTAMTATACGQAFGSGVLAITFYNFNGANQMTHAGTAFNSHVNFSVYSGPLKANTTDFRRVAVHELGHALGLAHENNANIPAIMSPTISNIEKPQPDDISGARALYGAP